MLQILFSPLCPYALMTVVVGHCYYMIPHLALYCKSAQWAVAISLELILHPATQITSPYKEVTSIHTNISQIKHIPNSASPQLNFGSLSLQHTGHEWVTESISEGKETAVLASLMVTFTQKCDHMSTILGFFP